MAIIIDIFSIFALIAFIAIIVLLVRLIPSKGQRGESRVAAILQRLPADRYKVINGILLENNGYSTQIDHVVVSVYGHKYTFRNPIWQNQSHIRALRRLLKEYGDIPHVSIVAFSHQASIGVNAHTPVIYRNQIPQVINHSESRILTPEQVESIYNILLGKNKVSKVARTRHTQNVR